MLTSPPPPPKLPTQLLRLSLTALLACALTRALPATGIDKPAAPPQPVTAQSVLDSLVATGQLHYVPARKKPHPIFGVIKRSSPHFTAARGTPVPAAGPGTVIMSGRYGGYGNVVIVQYSPDLCALYGHLQKTTVQTHDLVSAGQTIGTVGTSGYSTEPHLHVSLRHHGREILDVTPTAFHDQ